MAMYEIVNEVGGVPIKDYIKMFNDTLISELDKLRDILPDIEEIALGHNICKGVINHVDSRKCLVTYALAIYDKYKVQIYEEDLDFFMNADFTEDIAVVAARDDNVDKEKSVMRIDKLKRLAESERLTAEQKRDVFSVLKVLNSICDLIIEIHDAEDVSRMVRFKDQSCLKI